MDEKLAAIKDWLGTGSINLFGLPMSGKDTVGVRLAEALGARFLSSGMIIRQVEAERGVHWTDQGKLAPMDAFLRIILPYFEREDLSESALILSSVGRWSGEENEVMSVAARAGHEIKAAVLLNVSEKDVRERREAVELFGGRDGQRADDANVEIFETRIREFREKTVPVLEHYSAMGKLVTVEADVSRDEVFERVVEGIYEFIINRV